MSAEPAQGAVRPTRGATPGCPGRASRAGSTSRAGRRSRSAAFTTWRCCRSAPAWSAPTRCCSMLLNGSTEAIVSAAAFARVGHGSLAVVLLASIPGLMKFDLHLLVGRAAVGRADHPPVRRAAAASAGAGEVRGAGPPLGPLVHLAGRRLTPFLPIPNAIVYAVAGWTGMSWVTFLILDASARWPGPACWPASATRSGSTRSPWRRPFPGMGCGYQSGSWCL